MGQSLSHSHAPNAPSEPETGDLEASFTLDKSTLAADLPDDEKAREKNLEAVKKRFPRLTAQGYANLSENDRKLLKEYENSRLKKEHDKLTDIGTSKLTAAKVAKLKNNDDCIQPHTDEGGEAYFIGDIYQPINPVFAEEWRLADPGPYLRYVKRLATMWTHLEYLVHWMEVSCAPPKWKQLKWRDDRRKERAQRTKVCYIDYAQGKGHASDVFTNCIDLKGALQAKTPLSESRQARLIIVEDLSRDVVETLGALYDVDPLFFLSHIQDYLFHNTRDRWVELPNLDVDARRMQHFTLGYLRARYYEDEASFAEAESQNGRFNVLRRLDSDRSRDRFMNGLLDLTGASVALGRAKTSLWISPKKNEPVTAILLVDPTVTAPDTHALWCGYRPFENTPSMETVASEQVPEPPRKTLFEDVVFWSSRLTEDDISHVQKEPRSIGMPMYKLVIADWLNVLKYMTTKLGQIEWEFAKPHWGDSPGDIDRLLSKLSPWRRNVGYYETMISEAIARLFPPEVRAPLHASPVGDTSSMPMFMRHHGGPDKGVFSLWTDFQNVKRQMDEIQARIQSIESTATNAINIEESRRAVKQNKNLARLTFLATIFIPLNFTSSFLSVSPDFPNATTTIWLFFAIGVPLTCFALLVVDLSHPEGKGFVRPKWRRVVGRFKGPQTTASEDAEVDAKPIAKTSTIPWTQELRKRMTIRKDRTK